MMYAGGASSPGVLLRLSSLLLSFRGFIAAAASGTRNGSSLLGLGIARDVVRVAGQRLVRWNSISSSAVGRSGGGFAGRARDAMGVASSSASIVAVVVVVTGADGSISTSLGVVVALSDRNPVVISCNLDDPNPTIISCPFAASCALAERPVSID